MSYSPSADLPMPYGGYFVPPDETKRLGFTPLKLPTDAGTIFAEKKVKGILWFVSHCNADSNRDLAVQALAK
jgi:hypothetical protein